MVADEHDATQEWPLFENLNADRVLKIHTANSVYLIALVDKSKKLVAIQGGRFFPEGELVTLTGSSMGIDSSCLFMDRAILGLGLEIGRDPAKHPKFRLVTSPIKFVALAENPDLADQLRKAAKALS